MARHELAVPVGKFADAVTWAKALEGDFLTWLRIQCPGVWLKSGVRHRAEQLFTLQVDIWAARWSACREENT